MFLERLHRVHAWPLGCAPAAPAHNVFGWEASRVAPGFPGGGVPCQGASFAGSYDEAENWIGKYAERMKALILIFPCGDDMELFLARCASVLAAIPTAGGAAARRDAGDRGRIHPSGKDVTALALTEGEWESRPILFHNPVGVTVECTKGDRRSFARLRQGEEEGAAREWMERYFEDMGTEVWNRVALVTPQGKTLHMRPDGEGIAVSADLPADRSLELAVFDNNKGREALDRLVRPGSLVFGCAGLDVLLTEPGMWESLAHTSYLYGELVHLADGPVFANLSFSVLSRIA